MNERLVLPVVSRDKLTIRIRQCVSFRVRIFYFFPPQQISRAEMCTRPQIQHQSTVDRTWLNHYNHKQTHWTGQEAHLHTQSWFTRSSLHTHLLPIPHSDCACMRNVEMCLQTDVFHQRFWCCWLHRSPFWRFGALWPIKVIQKHTALFLCR